MRPLLLDVFRMVLLVAIPLASFTTGLGAKPQDGVFLLRRPGLALRSLLAVLILVPLWALLFVQLVRPAGPIAAGLLVAILSVGIGPMAAMKRMAVPSTEARFAFELNIVVIALSIVFIPVAVILVGNFYGRDLHLAPGAVARVVLERALVPMVLGALVARVFPAFAAGSRGYLALVIRSVLTVVVLIALLASWRGLLSIGVGGWLAAATVAAGAIAIGHLLGGPEAETRSVLAAASALRFPALAFLLAQLTARPREVMPEVLAYVLMTLVLLGIYGLVSKRIRTAAVVRRAPGAHPPGRPVESPTG